MTEEAAKKNFPEKIYFGVEYPGYVKSVEKAIETMGGCEKIANSVLMKSDDGLELSYDPEDMYLKPLVGDIVYTGNMLLKVTRKVKKYKDGRVEPIDSKWDVENMGIISKTARFRGMADWHFGTERDDNVYKYIEESKSLTSLGSIDKLTKELLEVPEIFYTTPLPFMAKMSWSFKTPGAKANPYTREHFELRENGVTPVTEYVAKKKKKNSRMIMVKYGQKEYPKMNFELYKGPDVRAQIGRKSRFVEYEDFEGDEKENKKTNDGYDPSLNDTEDRMVVDQEEGASRESSVGIYDGYADGNRANSDVNAPPQPSKMLGTTTKYTVKCML
ncbi:General transcription factor 3C polypeptide 5 [Zancudomyces culisetae]|uniref:General transcription factor 3C polypeptide 5 n=1 Tax=Zancudomyces culisetae TaxID=1213189 RepID=A0A1R1PL24_ZANCU|nr:General transcription factor 3C polypeptide 5 [Zancudomyces culisetae]|eukprot:OMH81670.1 General transcription factor 3C polypeptide 5 [Zancudomyces culisetae]